ncbi:MAG TPA: transglycosylase domain-containing protein [Candidatus Dormibacteraeota bacterium]|nr:transglycosylase domain-containing protein [Candidatus Dormibacteraeota bacterium]
MRIWTPALRLEAVLMLKTQLRFLRFPWTFHRLFAGLWRVYSASRLLRIASALAVVPLALILCGMIYISYNRTNLPDLDAFLRFEPPTMGHIYDANGHVLIELARERREIIQYKSIPDVLWQAILSAEDENFFSHAGVDYSVFPRLLGKTNIHALIARAEGSNGQSPAERAPVFSQGGSTITQQLVRGFFLQKLTSTKNSNTLQHEGLLSHVLACVIGVPGTNRFLLKVEEMRLSLWIEGEMQKRYGSKRRAKEELLARYASFIYLGNGRYGFAKASQYYFGIPVTALTAGDADKAALLAGITKSPGEYAPTLAGNQKPLRRRSQILALMVKNHFISAETAESSRQAPIHLAAHVNGPLEAPAAVRNVLDELKGLDATLAPDIGINQLLEGHIQVYATIDDRIQGIANAALESGLKLYERRHPQHTGLIQGSVVVLRNGDSAILAEAGGRRIYKGRSSTYSDYNRATQAMRQPGSAMKPIVYLAAFRQGALDLDTRVPDEPISVSTSGDRRVKWISNFDNQFKGVIPVRQALAESRNAVAVWVVQQIGINSVLKTARDVGIRTSLHRYDTTALGASEVTLLELANAYRMMASGLHAEPYVIAKIEQNGGDVIYSHPLPCCSINENGLELSMIQEGLRGVVRIPSGTAHALDARSFPIPVMGKTGTTNNYRDALFVGSTYGPDGITVAVRIGFDDNRSLGGMETGGRAALPVFREVMLKTYQAKLVGPVPSFPANMENNIAEYLSGNLAGNEAMRFYNSPHAGEAAEDDRVRPCRSAGTIPATNVCELPLIPLPVVYQRRDGRGRIVFTNE